MPRAEPEVIEAVIRTAIRKAADRLASRMPRRGDGSGPVPPGTQARLPPVGAGDPSAADRHRRPERPWERRR